VAAERLEDLADEAVGSPVRHADAASGPGDASHLGGGLGVVGDEHHAERRGDVVEARVGVRQRLAVRGLEGDLEAFGVRARGALFEQRRNVVGRRHGAAASRCGECRVAVARGDVEDALAPAQVERFGEPLAGVARRCCLSCQRNRNRKAKPDTAPAFRGEFERAAKSLSMHRSVP
jgi:hypothetical protein